MAGDDHSEASLTVAGAALALATIRDDGSWRGSWPDASRGVDAAGAQIVASLLRFGQPVPEAVAAAPALRTLWVALGLDPMALPPLDGATPAPDLEGGA